MNEVGTEPKNLEERDTIEWARRNARSAADLDACAAGAYYLGLVMERRGEPVPPPIEERVNQIAATTVARPGALMGILNQLRQEGLIEWSVGPS